MHLEIVLPLTKPSTPTSDPAPHWLVELSEIVDALPDLVATFDGEGRLLLLNATGIELLGPDVEKKLPDLILSDLFDEPDAERVLGEVLPAALERGSWSGSIPIRLPRLGNVETHQRWVAHRPDDDAMRAFTLVARVVEDHHADEVRNRREGLTALSMGFVHDINNVLGPISAYTDLVATVVGDESPARPYLERIASACDRGRSLSARLATLSRGHTPDRGLVDLVAIAREIHHWLRVSRPDLTIKLETEVEAQVEGDPVQLHQVVMNLGRNAIEAFPDRTGGVAIRMTHTDGQGTGLPRGRYVKIEVRDDGDGIDEQALAHIFDPFFSTRRGGSGLGLALSRDIVRAHDGAIAIARLKPTGTAVTVHLPLAPDSDSD